MGRGSSEVCPREWDVALGTQEGSGTPEGLGTTGGVGTSWGWEGPIPFPETSSGKRPDSGEVTGVRPGTGHTGDVVTSTDLGLPIRSLFSSVPPEGDPSCRVLCSDVRVSDYYGE